MLVETRSTMLISGPEGRPSYDIVQGNVTMRFSIRIFHLEFYSFASKSFRVGICLENSFPSSMEYSKPRSTCNDLNATIRRLTITISMISALAMEKWHSNLMKLIHHIYFLAPSPLRIRKVYSPTGKLLKGGLRQLMP